MELLGDFSKPWEHRLQVLLRQEILEAVQMALAQSHQTPGVVLFFPVARPIPGQAAQHPTGQHQRELLLEIFAPWEVLAVSGNQWREQRLR